MLLSPTQISALRGAAISAGIDRRALLSGIDPRFVVSLRASHSSAEQLLLDLDRLNQVDALADGTTPMRTWLENAMLLAGPRRERQAFEQALRAIDSRRWRATSPPAGAGAPAPPPGAVRVYISAARADLPFVEALERHLSVLVRQGRLDVWHRSRMPAGADHRAMAQRKLDEAAIALIIVSANYLDDQAMYAEAMHAVALPVPRRPRVIPVIARPCLWEHSVLAEFSPLPRNGRSITALSDMDAAYAEIVRELSAVIDDLGERVSATITPYPSVSPQASASASPAERLGAGI